MNCYHDMLDQDSYCDDVCPICQGTELSRTTRLLWDAMAALRYYTGDCKGNSTSPQEAKELLKAITLHLLGDNGYDDEP